MVKRSGSGAHRRVKASRQRHASREIYFCLLMLENPHGKLGVFWAFLWLALRRFKKRKSPPLPSSSLFFSSFPRASSILVNCWFRYSRHVLAKFSGQTTGSREPQILVNDRAYRTVSSKLVLEAWILTELEHIFHKFLSNWCVFIHFMCPSWNMLMGGKEWSSQFPDKSAKTSLPSIREDFPKIRWGNWNQKGAFIDLTKLVL